MNSKHITLAPLTPEDREQFILDNQRAFRYGALSEFEKQDNRMEDGGEIISRNTVESCIDADGNET